MASSLISNTIQVYFDSVLEMDNEGMVAMFEALISSGLSGFLGCSSAIFETALVEFFHNASIRDGVVVSTIQGKPVAISEELFASTFELSLVLGSGSRPPARQRKNRKTCPGDDQYYKTTHHDIHRVFKVTTLLALVPGSNRNYNNAGSSRTCVTLNGSGIQLAVGPQPLRFRKHNSGLAHRIMVKRLATSPHDPLGITDSACKNQLVVVSVQYGPFNPYIPIRSTTIGKSRVAIDPIAMHTSWRSNSDIASVTSIGYPRMSASGESSTTMHRLLHASEFHPIPTPYDPKTNHYNQDLGLIHSTNGNHLESPNEGSLIDHQVTIYLHAQNITMLPTNETWYFASQILVSNSGGLILILTVQSTRNSSAYTVTIRCVS
ncbi:hypothetical protein F511_26160 [Dorcoceras hygrometricum]|uniref:Uncharacterized protein n=1 Tax=Dorcoceras hygrometricum TaxID=472368 RepID=A0A2Z7A434_9LAMI|nr:hypothetical protein F511_26160 [Dorcoceras hygrometricum]